MTIIYDPSENMLLTLLSVQQSGIMPVVKSAAFVSLVLGHYSLLILDRNGPGSNKEEGSGHLFIYGDGAEGDTDYYLPEMDYHAYEMVLALPIFFLVFYCSEAYGRLQMFWGHCVGLGAAVMNWVCLVRNNLPGDPDIQWNCTRLLLASMRERRATQTHGESRRRLRAPLLPPFSPRDRRTPVPQASDAAHRR